MRFLFRFIGWIVALCAIIGLVAFIFWTRAPEYLGENLSKQLKVPVTIQSIDLSLNQITINRFEIANLPNSYLKKSFSAHEIALHSPISNYIKKVIEIPLMTIDDIYLGLEFDSPKGAKGNWSILMKNLESAEKPGDESDQKAVIIKELILRNIQVEVVYKTSGGTVKKFPVISQIILRDINTEKGFPVDQLMQSVLGQTLKSVFVQENLKNMFEGVLEEPQNTLNSLLKPFGLF